MRSIVVYSAFRVALIFGFLTGPQAAVGQSGALSGEWPAWGGDLGATRFAPLEQITSANVDSLRVAWRWSARNFGPAPESYYRTTPLMVNGVIYTTAGTSRAVSAIDAATGETLWVWRMDEGDRAGPRVNSGRGVAYGETPSGEGRIYVITPGFQLVALDARTGREAEAFGRGGVVDLRSSLEYWWGSPVDVLTADTGSSSPPVVAGGLVIVAPAAAASLRPRSMRNVPGYIQAFDAETGEPRWVFHTVPKPGEPGYETWEDGSAEYTGNIGAWPTFSADEELGLVYLPLEAATSDYYGGHRPGDNLYSSSLVALDLQTGERVWHYQIVRHDIFDWDNPTAPILADIQVDGRPVKAVVQLTKQSWAYVFDRQTGEPVWPFEERPVPASDVPGESAATHQPVPTKPPAYEHQGFSMDDLIDFTPEIRRRAEELVAGLRMGPIFTPPSLLNAPDGTRGTLTAPGSQGGTNWNGGVFDPETGVLYVPSINQPRILGLQETPELDIRYQMVTGNLYVDGIPIVKPPWGRITAIDLNRGDIVWQVANGDTPEAIRNHPLLEGVTLPRTGWTGHVGLLVTRNFLFAGEGAGTAGTGTEAFRAHDKRTGEILWETRLPGIQTGMPMAYVLDGKPYIVMAVVGADRNPELVALTLP